MKGLLTFLFTTLLMVHAWAEDTINSDQVVSRTDEINASINYVKPNVLVPVIPETIYLIAPEGYRLIINDQAKYVRTELWGNPPREDYIAILLPDKYKVTDAVLWGATISYTNDGYVSDINASDLDADLYLEHFKEETQKQSEASVKAGYTSVEMIGWAEPPHYDKEKKILYWAKELAFGNRAEHVVNLDVRLLYRGGYVTINVVTPKSMFAEVKAELQTILTTVNFGVGHAYGDHNKTTDLKAPYELGTLVAAQVRKDQRVVLNDIVMIAVALNILVLAYFVIRKLRGKPSVKDV